MIKSERFLVLVAAFLWACAFIGSAILIRVFAMLFSLMFFVGFAWILILDNKDYE